MIERRVNTIKPNTIKRDQIEIYRTFKNLISLYKSEILQL